MSPQARRAAVDVLIQERGYGVTRACGLVGNSRSLYRYRSRRTGSAELVARLKELAAEKRRYGYRRLHVLLRREGHAVNRKRTYRHRFALWAAKATVVVASASAATRPSEAREARQAHAAVAAS